ncbi:hypothetical protein CSB20_04520 [bacterium DOLZORAL124_64_63]|nr:MAG: hypothetical protein CSB20_04520 [bacterium DOLZORAL124_64_63]
MSSSLCTRSGVQALVLLGVTAVLAAAGWALRPNTLPLVADPLTYELELSAPLVELDAALTLFREGNHYFIDTRPDAGAGVATLSGSFVVRERELADDLLRLMDVLYPEDPVILFGDGNLMGVSNVAAQLQERGFTAVQIMRSGVTAWQKAGGAMGEAYIPETPTAPLEES